MEDKNIKEENTKSDAALREERILEFWRENKTFEKSLEKKSPKGEFIFYEGPPTANGKPGIHHLESRSFKDAIPRYKTMQGFHVRRKGGWDTHGLPVELQVEKKLGLNSKKAIEAYGIAKFNQECKESVWEYVDLWNKFTERAGYWIDEKNPYVTYHNNFIESVWSVLKKVSDQGLLYKDYRVVPWCPRCGTALSSHELAQGYEEVKDLSITVKFKVKGEENTYILAWTTTPWTLPGNVALAVGENIDYVKIKMSGEFLILAKARLSIITDPYKIVDEVKGSSLIGLEYEPLYLFLTNTVSANEKLKLEKAFKVYGADFVNTEEGTGIVHTAVMYGQDDFVLGTKIGLPKHHLVNPEGKFIKGTGFFEGRFVREVDENGKPTLAVDIIEDLKKKNLFFKQENYKHSYPHCWRCHTALIYYARDSWYIKMSDPKIKGELISQNQEINWEPAYIRDGRFGEWLREVKDWAISRERYWGTPLPVWECASCKKIEVIESISNLKKRTKKSGNKYFVMRHGGTEANKEDMISFGKQNNDKLTAKGGEQVAKTAEKIKNKKIDLIISSSFVRARETAAILKEKLGLKNKQVIFDDRLQEVNAGIFDGKSWNEYHQYLLDIGNGWFSHKIPSGESLKDVARRTGEVLYEMENKYKGKNILIVTHGGPAWLLFVDSGLFIPENKPYQVANAKIFVSDFKRFDNAEVRELPFVPLPHNRDYELDLHRPYIDEVPLVCSCGGDFIRIKEVMDVWFDSGCVPFAQDHYPFENKKWVDGPGYPADFISEAIDQTRGWFYTLHAVGILMGRDKAFKNVICLGHLLDAKGKKMSKSIGNVVDPWKMMDTYGVDTLRLWMYSINQPGESKNFDEKTVMLLSQQVFGLLFNVLTFYELYRDKTIEKNASSKSKNILDIWILARLDELVELMTKNLDNYKLLEPVRAVKDFIGDLSTWYLRRSRERIKEGDKQAKATLYFVLKSLSKIIAPFAPFAGEEIWLKLKNEKDTESVHLAEWPKAGKVNSEILEDMRLTRTLCTDGNAERQKLRIPLRQPLNSITIRAHPLSKEYEAILKEELNVKKVVNKSIFISSLDHKVVEFDTNITSELKQEGDYRELVRALQDIRKKIGLTPNDIVVLTFETGEKGKKLIQKFEKDMKKTVLLSKIEFKKNNGEEIKIDELVFKVKIEK
jgi:isoleucyl-tRNA synthetase